MVRILPVKLSGYDSRGDEAGPFTTLPVIEKTEP
jgi:hypothetical protein